MKFFVLTIIFCLILKYSAYYHRYTKEVQTIRKINDETLNDDVFITITRPSIVNSFPNEFECVYLNSELKYVKQKFVLIDGLLNKPSTKIDVYTTIKGNTYKKVELTNNLVKTEFYHSTDGSAVATLIENKDLFGQNIKIPFQFRAIITLYDNQTNEEYHIVPYIIDYKSSLKSEASIKIESRLSHRIYMKNQISKDFNTDFVETLNALLENQFYKPSVKINQSPPVSLFVEAVIVADYSAFLKHQTFIGTNDTNLTVLFMKIYYSHMLNGVNQRYINAFNDDPELRIEVRLNNFVLQTELEQSYWTNFSYTGVPDYPTYNGREVVESTRTLISFRSFMLSQKFPFSYDHAFGIFDKDLWGDDDGKSTPSQRSSVSGSAWVGGICNTFRFSICEDSGFNAIPTLTHELGHNLGSYHDGFPGNILSSQCNPLDNYIMTPSNGNSRDKLQNHFKFSDCSITQFKSTLFNMNGNLKPQFSCLANLPILTPKEAFYFDSDLPGQLFDANSQCKLIIGNNSTHKGCETPSICETLYCKSPAGNSCRSIIGWGAADGTSCNQDSICKSGQCVSISEIPQINQCSINPCLNDGTCIQIVQFYLCNCRIGYTGLNCEIKYEEEEKEEDADFDNLQPS